MKLFGEVSRVCGALCAMCAGRWAGGNGRRRRRGCPAVRRTLWRQWEGSFEVPWKGNKKVPADEGPFPDSSEAVLSLQTTVDSKVVDAKYTINNITADTLTQKIKFLCYPALQLN